MNNNEMYGSELENIHKHICYRCNEQFDCDCLYPNRVTSICGNCDKRYNAENEYLKRFKKGKENES